MHLGDAGAGSGGFFEVIKDFVRGAVVEFAGEDGVDLGERDLGSGVEELGKFRLDGFGKEGCISSNSLACLPGEVRRLPTQKVTEV